MTESTVPAGVRGARARSSPARWFYSFAGVLLLVLTAWGFKMFYLRGESFPGRPLTAPIRTLVIFHGVLMSGWTVLFAVQPVLIATRRYRQHMALGRVGAVLAACMLLTGLYIAVRSAQVTPADAVIWGLHPKAFMAVPLAAILLFSAFVGIGLWKRKKPAVHKPCMLLGTLSAAAAAISRIAPLDSLYAGTVWERLFGPFFVAILIGVALVVVRAALTRSFDRVLTIGMGVLIVVGLLTMAVARTGAWDSFASALVR